jgi:hypothetical protein
MRKWVEFFLIYNELFVEMGHLLPILDVDLIIIFIMVSQGRYNFHMYTQHMYFFMNVFFVEDASLQHLDRSIYFFIFTPLTWTSNNACTNISWIRYIVRN